MTFKPIAKLQKQDFNLSVNIFILFYLHFFLLLIIFLLVPDVDVQHVDILVSGRIHLLKAQLTNRKNILSYGF